MSPFSMRANNFIIVSLKRKILQIRKYYLFSKHKLNSETKDLFIKKYAGFRDQFSCYYLNFYILKKKKKRRVVCVAILMELRPDGKSNFRFKLIKKILNSTAVIRTNKVCKKKKIVIFPNRCMKKLRNCVFDAIRNVR